MLRYIECITCYNMHYALHMGKPGAWEILYIKVEPVKFP